MTRTAVDNTIARLKAWVRKEVQGSCGGCDDALDDLEDLRQHDEKQAAEVERLRYIVAPWSASPRSSSSPRSSGGEMSIPTRGEVERIARYEFAGTAFRIDERERFFLDADAALRAEIKRLRAALVAAADDLQRDADKLLEPAGGLDYEHQAPAVQEAIDALDKRATVLRAAAEGKS